MPLGEGVPLGEVLGEEGEEDRGRKKNGGMNADVIRLVLAEYLVRYLHAC